jgi:hypothetical protein
MAQTGDPRPRIEQLTERVQAAARQNKGLNLRADEVYTLSRVLARALALIADAEQLDREADAAAYCLTGSWPSLEKYRAEHGAAESDR